MLVARLPYVWDFDINGRKLCMCMPCASNIPQHVRNCKFARVPITGVWPTRNSSLVSICLSIPNVTKSRLFLTPLRLLTLNAHDLRVLFPSTPRYKDNKLKKYEKYMKESMKKKPKPTYNSSWPIFFLDFSYFFWNVGRKRKLYMNTYTTWRMRDLKS